MIPNNFSYIKGEIHFVRACGDKNLALLVCLPAASATRVRKEKPEFCPVAELELFEMRLAVQHNDWKLFGTSLSLGILADLEKCRSQIEDKGIGLEHADEEKHKCTQ